jgi:CRP/FNR family cyclic AMP-dependent transcriptional regulator
MFIKEVEIFRDLGPAFMGEIAKQAHEEFYEAGHILFNNGDPAENLYILRQGRVKLFIQEGGSINIIVDKAGGIFGWSALVEPNVYTASAQCEEPTRVIRIKRSHIEEIFQKSPREAYLVMKRLAGVVGLRLVNSYKEILRSRSHTTTPSYG